MEAIELVIKIPKEMYKWIYDVNKFSNDYGIGDFIDLIQNGTPLDKHDEEIIAETVESIWGKPPYAELLDKIRAEFEEHAKINQNLNIDRARAICWCLDIIDKYMAEVRNRNEKNHCRNVTNC